MDYPFLNAYKRLTRALDLNTVMYIESIIQYLSGHIRDICGTKVIISIC
jgi:hypothetical protein